MKKLYHVLLFFLIFIVTINLHAEEKVEQTLIEDLQTETTNEHYFKLLIDEQERRVTALYIYDKQTNILVQEVAIDCMYIGNSAIEVFDYNFDGIDDFSVFESFYAGPNTTRLYFLREPKSNKYILSNIYGTSLEFDSETKTVWERNQCCAGTSVWTAKYSIINNDMVLIEEHCYKWDEELNDLVEKNIEECR